MPYTLQQAAQAAIDVQNACNLSGVLHSLDDIVRNTLWPEANRVGQGTPFVNQHPIVACFLDKLASLNRTQCLCSDCLDNHRKYFDEVIRLAEVAA